MSVKGVGVYTHTLTHTPTCDPFTDLQPQYTITPPPNTQTQTPPTFRYAADVLPALKKDKDASLKKEAKFEFGAYAKAAGALFK